MEPTNYLPRVPDGEEGYWWKANVDPEKTRTSFHPSNQGRSASPASVHFELVALIGNTDRGRRKTGKFSLRMRRP